MGHVAAAARATVHAQSAASVIGRGRCEAAYVCVAVRDVRRDLSAMPVADWLMANHPEPREQDVGQDQGNENLRSPTSPAARSAATIAAPAVAAPAAPVTAVSAMSASATVSATAAVHHDEIARVPGRRRAGGTYEFA